MSIDGNISELMGIVDSTLGTARETASRIGNFEPAVDISFKHTIANINRTQPNDPNTLLSPEDSTFDYQPNLDDLEQPDQIGSMISSDTRFSYTVSRPSLERPGAISEMMSDVSLTHTIAGINTSQPSSLNSSIGTVALNHSVSDTPIERPGSISDAVGTVTPFNYEPSIAALSRPDSLLLDQVSNDVLIDWIDVQAERWFSQYFPEINGCLKGKPEEWLCGVISGSATYGGDPAMFEAVWHQARDREYRARNSATAQLRRDFSARGFKMPPGAMLGLMAKQEEQTADAIAGVNLAQAIRDSEIKVDLLKFAQQQAIQLKMGVMSELVQFYNLLLQIPKQGIEESALKVNAYSSLNAALDSYHRVELGFEELRMKAAELRSTGSLEESRLKVSAYTALNNAIAEYRRGNISIEELRLQASEARARIELDSSGTQISAFSATSQALDNYLRGQISVEGLKQSNAEARARIALDNASAKTASYTAMNNALAEYNRLELAYQELGMKAAEQKASNAIEESRLKVQAYSSFNSAFIEFQRGKISAEELKLRAAEVRSSQGLERSRLILTGYSSFASAMSDYERGRISLEELKVKVAELDLQCKIEKERITGSIISQSASSSNSALGSAVRAFGDVAASAASAASTLQANIITGVSV